MIPTAYLLSFLHYMYITLLGCNSPLIPLPHTHTLPTHHTAHVCFAGAKGTLAMHRLIVRLYFFCSWLILAQKRTRTITKHQTDSRLPAMCGRPRASILPTRQAIPPRDRAGCRRFTTG
jgi:hypothetical protein